MQVTLRVFNALTVDAYRLLDHGGRLKRSGLKKLRADVRVR